MWFHDSRSGFNFSGHFLSWIAVVICRDSLVFTSVKALHVEYLGPGVLCFEYCICCFREMIGGVGNRFMCFYDSCSGLDFSGHFLS